MWTSAGILFLLNTVCDAARYTATFYAGYIDGSGAPPVFDPADTMDNHPGWVELTTYQGDRRAPVSFAPAANGAAMGFANPRATFTADCVVGGYFLTTDRTKGGTTGILVGGDIRTPVLPQGVGDQWGCYFAPNLSRMSDGAGSAV